MSKFNFDPEHFRRVIAKCEKTLKIPTLNQALREAVEVFYDEYDYYPDVAAFAPGTFTIMGDHLEYVKGNLVQAALPVGTVVVGKGFCSIKCKLFTTSKCVEGLKKAIFSIFHYKKNLKVYPEWVNYIKGVINSFPDEEVKGFDAVLHSYVPCCQGYGSSAALQVGFYTFLEALVGFKKCTNKAEKGNFCYMAENLTQPPEKKIGKCSCFTSSVASTNVGVKINCRTKEVSTFDMRDINILFLLTYPKFPIELNDRDLVFRRELELKLVARLLGLEEIIDATPCHLDVLSEMEDPTKEAVTDILREYCDDEDLIGEIVDDLFFFPKADTIPEVESLYGEGVNYALAESQGSEKQGEDQEENQEENQEEEVKGTPCLGLKSEVNWTPKPPPPSVNYIQERIAELCDYKNGFKVDLPQAVCEEINCLGGIENLSVDSDLTVCGKLLRRLRHVVTENIRSLSLSDLVSQVQYEELGTMLIQSHLSLKIDFAVSCPTLDGLVQIAINSDRVYGAKMTSGGGTLTLLHRSVVEEFVGKIIDKYGDKIQFYLVFPSSGAKIVDMGIRKNPRSTLSDVLLTRDELLRKAIENFLATYKYRPTHGAFSPGVIHLLGDHAEYNHGFCLSIALNMLTVIVGAFNGTSKVRAVTTADVGDENPKVIFDVLEAQDEENQVKVKWAKPIKGVIMTFEGAIKGFDCMIDSSLPDSFGAASKPTLVRAMYTFMEDLTGDRRVGAAKKAHDCMLILQQHNNSVIGVGENTAAFRSKDDFVILFDCRSTATTLIPFQNPGVTLLLTFVEVKVKCTQAMLFRRMEECYEVAKALGGKTLRCLTLKDLDALKGLPKKVKEKSIRRAKHVITENERVLKAAEALKNNDYQTLGELMVASHNSLRDDYEIVDPKIDALVATAMEVDGVLGSKMPSFGCMTCTLSLVNRWAVDDLIEYLMNSVSYKLNFYLINPSQGCKVLNVKEYVDELPSPQLVFEKIFPL